MNLKNKGELKRYEKINSFCRGKILNLGSGFSGLHEFLKKRHKQVFSVDLEEKADYNINLNDSKWNIKEKFDTIAGGEILEHIENPVKFIENCSKLLNKKGRLILTTPNATSLIYLFNPNWCINKTNRKGEHCHIHTFTSGMLENLFEICNFRILKIEYINTFIYNKIAYLVCCFVKNFKGDLLIVGEKNGN